MTPVPAEVFEKQAMLREMFKRILDAPHAAIARQNLVQAAQSSSAVEHAAHAAAQAERAAAKAHAVHDPSRAAVAAAKSEYAKKLPGAVSAKDARKAFDEHKQKTLFESAEKIAADIKGKLLQAVSPEQIVAARTAANAAHARHLGTLMPAPEALRAKYPHVTPDHFRAQYDKSLKDTGVQLARRRHTPASRGVESYIETLPDGTQRVSDAGLGYLHANELRAESAGLMPGDTRSHERFAVHGGVEGMLNHVAKLDIYGRPATNEVADSATALALMKPRNAATKALHQKIDTVSDAAQMQRMQNPLPAARGDAIAEVVRRRAAAAHSLPSFVPPLAPKKRLDALRAPAPTVTQGNVPTLADPQTTAALRR